MSLLEAISPTTAALLQRQQMIEETVAALGGDAQTRADLSILTHTRLAKYHREALRLNRSDAPTTRTTPNCPRSFECPTSPVAAGVFNQ